MASTYLQRTPSSEGNRKTWTFSGWFKRSDIAGRNFIFSGGQDNQYQNAFGIEFGDKFYVYDYDVTHLVTTASFKDTSAWYHVVVAVDTTQSTASNRIKLYINGEQITSFSTANYPGQNENTGINMAYPQQVGSSGSGTLPFDGYMAHVHLTDGTAYAASTFGSTATNGQWVPNIAPSVTYGTNGFFLKFTNASDLGEDFSGNNNDFTKTGSGDKVLDNPENVFATIFPFSANSGNISEGNLKYRSTTDSGTSTISVPSGKWYVEMYVNSNNNSYLGVIDVSANGINPNRGGSWTSTGAIAYKSNGEQYSLPVGGSASTASYGSSYTTGDIIGIALDITSNTITFYKNNVSQGTTTNGPSFIQSNGSYSFFIYGTDSTITFNAGQDSSFAGVVTAQNNADGNGEGDFYYTPPSGFLALCTNNVSSELTLPIGKGDSYFKPLTYTGNGTSQTVTGVGFQPDFVWIKNRQQADWHNLVNSTVGATKRLASNNTTVENTNAQNVSAFASDGFSVGNDHNTNANGENYISWNWLSNGGTTSSNTDGSITSTVQANTTAGFSIVTYTGNNTQGATVGHGLGKAPAMIFVKGRDQVTNWNSWHKSFSDNQYIALDLTVAVATDGSTFPDASDMTSSTFEIGSASWVNGNGNTFVAYCFAEIEGYSKIGTYTGNGSTNGTFIYTGFRPAWILRKSSSNVETWSILDSTRSPINAAQDVLRPNESNAEGSATWSTIDILSNGFKMRATDAATNGSGATYIYMAFAENPFVDSSGVPANAR